MLSGIQFSLVTTIPSGDEYTIHEGDSSVELLKRGVCLVQRVSQDGLIRRANREIVDWLTFRNAANCFWVRFVR